VNAVFVRELVRLRCGHGKEPCRRHIGTVYAVRGYHRAEIVFGPQGATRRAVDLDDGLVVTGTWHQSELRPSERRAPIPLEWPVVQGVRLAIMCPVHDWVQLTHDEVFDWAVDAVTKGTVVQRVVRRPVPAVG
jgi:hypothetical protein